MVEYGRAGETPEKKLDECRYARDKDLSLSLINIEHWKTLRMSGVPLNF